MKPLTGLFLGAGFSYEAGMPLVWDLTKELKNWLTPEKLRELNEGWRTQGGGHSDVVIEDLAGVLVRTDLHYEAILGHMETQFRRQRTLAQDYHGLYSWLVELVYRLLYFRQVNNRGFFSHHLRYYDGLKVLADNSQPLWIFSLNHDIIVEMLTQRLAIPLHNGFSQERVILPLRDKQGQKTGELSAETLAREILDNGAMLFPNPGVPGIYLLKLHGALDIFTSFDGKVLLKLCPVPGADDPHVAALRTANEDLYFSLPGSPNGRANTTNEISYADQTGEMQFLRRSLLAGAYKFDTRHTQVLPISMLKHFRANINFVTHLVCIGYSFGDLHMNGIIREWLEHSQTRTLEIVSPDAQPIPSLLLHLAPQVTVTTETATDYLDVQAGIVRGRRDVLEKRLSQILRGRSQETVAKVMRSFAEKIKARSTNELVARLKALPQRNGKPDLGGVDPTMLAQQWGNEIGLTPESTLESLIDDLEAGGIEPGR